jgi:hypothetical protein
MSPDVATRQPGDGSEPRSQYLRARSPARPQGGGQPGPKDGERPGVEPPTRAPTGAPARSEWALSTPPPRGSRGKAEAHAA